MAAVSCLVHSSDSLAGPKSPYISVTFDISPRGSRSIPIGWPPRLTSAKKNGGMTGGILLDFIGIVNVCLVAVDGLYERVSVSELKRIR